MTSPTPVVPSKLKTWVALAGSALAFIVPLIVSVQDLLPQPWPAVIGGAIAVLTALGVYRAPYTPPPGPVAVAQPPFAPAPLNPDGTYQSPWPKP